MLGNANIRKAAGVDDLARRFLKDISRILLKPIRDLCNISIKLGRFPDSCKIAKLNLYLKKGSKLTFPITAFTATSPKSLENLSMNKQVVFCLTVKFYATNFGKSTQQTHALRFCMIKFSSVLIMV